jgi:hypothetical protein
LQRRHAHLGEVGESTQGRIRREARNPTCGVQRVSDRLVRRAQRVFALLVLAMLCATSRESGATVFPPRERAPLEPPL